METIPIIDYEGSDYQQTFWEQGDRAYEDAAEAVALRRLLPPKGDFLLELGAGAGRNTPRYQGFARVALLDYSLSQLQQAQKALGTSARYVYVAADVYALPFLPARFDATTLIRTLHHLAEPRRALAEARRVLRPEGIFVLEFANKRNLKAIARYALRRQSWSPFDPEPIEFAPLNFDFHPRAVRAWLRESGLAVDRQLTVSHLRIGWLKRHVPLKVLVTLDSLFQWSGNLWQLTPSVFVRARATGPAAAPERGYPEGALFACPRCAGPLDEQAGRLVCPHCRLAYPVIDGIYDLRNKDARPL